MNLSTQTNDERLGISPAAVVVAAVVCSLLASTEQPDKISMAAAATCSSQRSRFSRPSST
jgi:hypothetical protein